MKRSGIIIFIFSLMLPFNTLASAKETLKGYITGNLCGANSMVCPVDHRDGKKERIVFMAQDGKSIYELKGADKKQLYNHFSHLVQIEGEIKGNAIQVQKISHLGASKAGKIIGKGDTKKHMDHQHDLNHKH